MVALSVSTSQITSPDLTTSPTLRRHRAIVPLSMVGDRAIIGTFSAMGPPYEVQRTSCRGDDLLDRGLRGQLERVVVRHRHVFARHQLHGRVQVVEAVAGHEPGHVRAHAGHGPRLVDDHAATRLPHGAEHGLVVEGPEAAQVDHLGVDARGRERLGRLEGEAQGLGVRDERDILPRALHVRGAQGHEVLALGHLALPRVHQLRLEEHHGVVVADGGLQQPLGVSGRRREPRPSGPGTCAYSDCSACECWAARYSAGPLGPRKTIGTRNWPPDM